MGVHYTRPTLPPGALQKAQALATALVGGSRLAKSGALAAFFREASQWLDPGDPRATAPWQRGAAPFLEDVDLAEASAAGRQSWYAFHQPNLAYAASRGALEAWPGFWSHTPAELGRALSSVDVRSADSCAEALCLAAGALAWEALRHEAEARMLGELREDVLSQCKEPSFSRRLNGYPSKSCQFEGLLAEARAFLKVAVLAAAQRHAAAVLSSGAAVPLPRPKHPRPFRKRSARAGEACGLFAACALSARMPTLVHPEEVDLDEYFQGEDEGQAAATAWPRAPQRWHKPQAKEGESVGRWPRQSSFLRLSELKHEVDQITPVVQELQREFDTLWSSRRKDFLPWRERDEVVSGWVLFGTHLFGQRLEEHCSAAPVASRLAEALGATLAGLSVLLPGTHVEPHSEDPRSASTRLHVGLRVPPADCGLRVREEAKVWEEGSILAFRSFYDHEAWNFSSEPRAVLLLDLGAQPLPVARWPLWLRQHFPTLAASSPAANSDFEQELWISGSIRADSSDEDED